MKKLAVILGMLFTLSVNAQQQISGPASICAGQSATLIAQVPGFNTDTLQFQWSMNGVLFGLSNDTIVVTPGVGTWNYSVVIVTNGNQFVGNIYTTLTVNQIPTATAIGGAFCENSTISLTGGGGVSYNWSGPNGFSSSLQNPTITQATLAANGTYSLVVSNSFGCSDTTTTQVVVNPLPTPTITVSPNDTVCLGTQVALFATGGVSYSWSVGGNGPSTTWTPTTTGNLVPSVFVTDGNGCSALEFLPMVVNPAPAVTAVATPVTCFGGSNASITTNVSGGSSFSYLWSNGATTPFVSGLPIGNYSVTVTNNFGCLATTTAVVTEPLAAVTASTTVTNVSCFGGTNGMITVNAFGGTGTYQYRIGNGPWVNNNVFSGLSTGNYTIMVRDANNCQFTLPVVNISGPAALTTNANGGSVTCNGDNNGTAVVSVVGGTLPYSYQWSNGGQGDSLVGLSAGMYIVTVTDANNCTVIDTAVVSQPAPVTFTFNQTNVQCNGQATGSITASAAGGTTPYQYRLNNGIWTSANTFSGLTAGSYSISVRDTNQCTAGPVTVAITEPIQLQLQMADTNAICNGNGSAWVIPSGGVAPYSFAWSNGSSNDTIWASPGFYQVTVTDANNCVAVGAATIGQPIIPTIVGAVDSVSCFGLADGGIDISPSGVGPFTYNWSNGSTNQDLVNIGAGIYNIIVTGSNGCIGTNQFTVNQPAILAANVPSTTVACNGNLGSLTASVTGGTGPYTYTWSTTPVQTGMTATNLVAGLAYTVTVTDANGCTTQATGSVIQPTAVVASITNVTNIPCVGNLTGNATATATGGQGAPYSFLWSNGSQLNQAFGLPAGTHTLTVTDVNGCSDTTSVTIIQASSLLVVQIYVDQQPCNNNGGITVGVSGGATPYTYQWNNGMTGSVLTGLAPGTYEVTVTDGNGCVATSDIGLQPDNSFTITTSPVINYCIGSGATVEATVTLATQPLSYQWRDPNNNLFSTAQAIEPTMSGIWTLIVNNGLGCPQTAYITINLVNCPLTSVGEVSLDDQVVVFPNPISFNGTATVQLPSNIHEVHIEVRNVVGQILLQGKTNNDTYTFNTSGLAAGTYFVQIATVDGSVSTMKKFIIN